MFDKLIVSEPEGADFKNRRNYFMASSLVVGVLFLAALVVSIFASDYGLGTNGIELAELLQPTDMAAAEPERPQPRMPQTPSNSTSQLPMRQVNMSRTDEPTIVPLSISTAQNNYQSRPLGQFISGPSDSTPSGSGRNNDGPETSGPNGLATTQSVPETTSVPDPPVKAPPIVKKPPVQSLGVVNGRASDLVKPVYSAAAKAVNAQGTVEVQVMIDEAGKVVSAHAISGNMLLRPAAEVAARRSRFTPTLLSTVPIKLTGVIVYNFIR